MHEELCCVLEPLTTRLADQYMEMDNSSRNAQFCSAADDERELLKPCRDA
jgi:hypothetical protein